MTYLAKQCLVFAQAANEARESDDVEAKNKALLDCFLHLIEMQKFSLSAMTAVGPVSGMLKYATECIEKGDPNRFVSQIPFVTQYLDRAKAFQDEYLTKKEA
jgi:hypothetical protein